MSTDGGARVFETSPLRTTDQVEVDAIAGLMYCSVTAALSTLLARPRRGYMLKIVGVGAGRTSKTKLPARSIPCSELYTSIVCCPLNARALPVLKLSTVES